MPKPRKKQSKDKAGVVKQREVVLLNHPCMQGERIVEWINKPPYTARALANRRERLANEN